MIIMSRMLQTLVKSGHMPRIDTVSIVEDIIKKKGYFNSRTALHKSLNNRIQYGTLLNALEFLEKSNKIEFNKDGSLVWIFLDKRNKALSRTLKKSISLR